MTISKDDSVILDGAGDKKAIEERCDQVCLFVPSILCSVLWFIGNNMSGSRTSQAPLMREI